MLPALVHDPAITGAIAADPNVILATIHRHDNFITLHQGERLKLVAALRPHELVPMLPGLAGQLLADAYYSINGMRKQWRRAELVSDLTCVFCDVDFHDEPTPERIELAIARVTTLAAQFLIPQPTMIARSGRGFWCFWLLRQPDVDRAVPVTSSSRALWIRVQRALCDRMAGYGLPVDRAATDVARLTRLPESINGNSGARVLYTVNYGDDGPMRYTLASLALVLGVPEQHPVIGYPTVTARPQLAAATMAVLEVAPHTARSARAASGWRALRERRLRDLELLIELRGARLRKGVRNRAAWLLAHLLRGRADLGAWLQCFAYQCCEPPLTAAEAAKPIKQVAKGRRFKISDQKIGEWLEITAEENDRLEGEYLLAPKVPVVTRNQLMQRRRELVGQICSDGCLPPLRLIKKELASRGIGASPETIRADLAALGKDNPRRWGRQEVLPASIYRKGMKTSHRLRISEIPNREEQTLVYA